MKIILVRHGKTIDNEKHVIQGHHQGKLSKKGIRQAKKLGRKLKKEKIDFVYCSDLKRTRDTAKGIMEYHKNTPIIFTKGLRERSYGEFEGKRVKDIGWNKKDIFNPRLKPRGGESINQLYKRAKKLIKKIIRKHKNSTILLVGHRCINRVIADIIMNNPPIGITNIKDPKNASITIFNI